MLEDVRTSASHPIYVDWLPVPKGRLGLTFAPGKHQRGLYSGIRWERDLGVDLERLKAHEEVDVLVCLLEDHEFEALAIPAYEAETEALGFTVIRLPIPDGGVPDEVGMVEALVGVIAKQLNGGAGVAVHCAGGLGRAGTIAGCFLRALGRGSDEALQILTDTRGPNCPENASQRAFISSFSYRVEGPRESAILASSTHEERWLGAVLGAAIGDAMGHPTEFMDMARIHENFGSAGVTGFELYWERDGQRFAPYTDDTQMAEIVLGRVVDAVEAGEDLDAAMTRLAHGFIEWEHQPQGGHRAPGSACRAGCRALEAGFPWDEAGNAKAGGCGSVMRAYPLGLVFADDADKAEAWAVAQSRLTHGDPIALAAFAAMAAGVRQLYHDASPADAVTAMIEAAGRYSQATAAMMTQARDEALDGTGPEITLDRLRAWAAHEAIAAAVYVLLRHPDDPRAAILEAANTPGDSDSIATLAGALLGARLGITALPKDWVQNVERSQDLATLSHRGSLVTKR
jgi:ADP-ribosylglycohydrolase